MKTSMPCQFLAAWMSVVCYLPPIYLFTDAHLLPKWYLCLIGLTVTGVLAAVTLWRGRRNGWNGETLSFVYKVYDATGDEGNCRQNRHEACEGQLSGRDENKKEVQVRIENIGHMWKNSQQSLANLSVPSTDCS